MVGEERTFSNLQIVIEADRKEIAAGQSVGLRAYGLDRGRRIALDPARLHWSMEDPTGGRFNFDPRRPPTEQDELYWLAHHREELRVNKLRVTFEMFTGIILIPTIANGYVDVSAGNGVSCGLRLFGELFCWGSNASLMLGISNTTPPDRCTDAAASNVRCSVRPMAVAAATMRFSSVSVGNNHVCALQMVSGAAYCWGNNALGQIGIPTTTPWQNAPVAVSPPAGTSTALAFRSISAGRGLTCAIATTGDEYCWGDGYGSQPVLGWHGWGSQPGGPGASATSVSFGFSCRMNSIGVWCDRATNPRSISLRHTFLGQGSTAEHVCAIDESATTWCWGNSSNGKLGNGTPISGRTPVNTPSPLNSVAAGSSHSCGLAGTIAYCWGSNLNGELGIGTGPSAGSSAPLQVTNGPNTPAWRKISAGLRHTCALDNGGEIWCWGTNYMGQLGIGTSLVYNSMLGTEAVVTPTRTVGP
ncbi:MAG: RCC1 domain-containing protein [Longimicrobiales bacterium]